ncbi:MAG: Na(+)/H(+) antiporter subunit D [Thiohalobacterales bacterium]|nr:Na(+)/H(+) antiporter subunit D [Thiohalobacterales bacterium]
MTELLFPPGLLLIFGALLMPLGQTIRNTLIFTLPALCLVLIWSAPADYVVTLPFLGFELEPIRITITGQLFATIFSLMAFVGGLYAYRQANTLELSAAFVYAGSAIGVTLSGDLITLFVFWEVMAIGSTLVIWAAKHDGAYRASIRYLMIHLLGGLLLMAGIAGHVVETGSIRFEAMQLQSISQYLILAGFLVNAGAPPLSAWIADAYPEASPSGTVFLSAFTTKTAVFTLLIAFPGTWILIPIGIYMIFYGIIYALLENDMRRILAYSIVNQVGFMVTGIGLGTEMALNGAAAHAFAHIIYKALLLMSAGAVLYRTGKRRCTELGGLFQTMPWTALLGIIGALAISSFPFTSGFVSKSMISQSAADQHLAIIWFALAAASAGVFLHAGIKFPWFVFFQKDSGMRPPEAPRNMLLAMSIFAFLCIGLGVYPQPLYDILPFAVSYEPYTAAHLVAQFQLLLFAGLAFFVMLPMMKRTLTISLDFDWFYRYPVKHLSLAVASQSSKARLVWAALYNMVTRPLKGIRNYFMSTRYADYHLAESWPTGSMVFWISAILAAFLLLDIFGWGGVSQ